MRKRLYSLALMLTIMLSGIMILTGCSGSGSASGTPLSESLSAEGTHIWYECQNKVTKTDEDEEQYIIEDLESDPESPPEYGRETQVVWIKVYDSGKLTSYSCLKDVNLGHFSKLSDEEIIAELDSDTDTYICGQKDEPYEIYLYSDAAGQTVRFEGIPALIKEKKKGDPMYFMTLVSDEQLQPFQVYESYYGGFALYNYDETMFGQACMVTRCEKSDMFALDEMDLENAVLDYLTPETMLHEKNAALKEELAKASKAKK